MLRHIFNTLAVAKGNNQIGNLEIQNQEAKIQK